MNVADLMNAVVKKLVQSKTLHFIEKTCSVFENGAIMLTQKMEVWYKRPRWRFEIFYGNSREVYVIDMNGVSEYVYVLSPEGKWTRRKKSKFFSRFSPDELKFKLRFFGLDNLDIITYVSIMDDLWNRRPVWKIEGRVDKDRTKGLKVLWLIDKEDLVVRKVEEEGGFFEFEYGGEKKQCELPGGATITEFEVVEFPADLPSELFEVPPDAPIEETIMERLVDWLFETVEKD